MATASPALAAHPTPSPSSATVAIALDVADLQASSTYFNRILGFERTPSTERDGLIYETRSFRSPRFPGLELRLRAAFGKRPIGSGAGTVLYIRLTTPDLPALVSQIKDSVRWVGPPPADPLTATEVEFLDPDGYAFRLGY